MNEQPLRGDLEKALLSEKKKAALEEMGVTIGDDPDEYTIKEQMSHITATDMIPVVGFMTHTVQTMRGKRDTEREFLSLKALQDAREAANGKYVLWLGVQAGSLLGLMAYVPEIMRHLRGYF